MGYRTDQKHRWFPCLPIVALTFLTGILVGTMVIEGLSSADGPELDSGHPCVVALEHSDDIITSSTEAMQISSAALRQSQQGDVPGLQAGADRLRELGASVTATAALYDTHYASCMEGIE